MAVLNLKQNGLLTASFRKACECSVPVTEVPWISDNDCIRLDKSITLTIHYVSQYFLLTDIYIRS